jgi:glycosyltransferase involved in cell wall biosynthesis
MRILLVHRYYRPDVPAYAQMLGSMARRFADDGHSVTVLSTMPSYNDAYAGPSPPKREVVDGVHVIRLRLLRGEKQRPFVRLLNVGLFWTRVLLHAIRHRSDYELMTVASFPPILMGVLGRIVAKLTPIDFVYHYQDLWPEVATASGVMTEGPFARVCRRIDRWSAAGAVATVVLSEDMRATLADRGADITRCRVINNFIIDEYDDHVPLDPALQKRAGVYRVVFAGNLGRFQGLEVIIDAAHHLRDRSDIEFVFVGAGSLLQELEQRAGKLFDRTVRFFPFQPLPVVMRLLGDADLALISLAPGVIRTAYPSKTMTTVEADCRILAVVEPDSQLAREIEQHKLGTVCGSSSAADIAAAIQAEHERSQSAVRGLVQTAGRQLYGREKTLAAWAELVFELERARFTAAAR